MKTLICLIVQFLDLSFVLSINLFHEMLTKLNLQEPKILEIVKFMCFNKI